MYVSLFNVILGNNKKQVVIQSDTTTFSENISLLSTYALELGGNIINSNTVQFTSEEPFIEFVDKLLEF